MGQFMQSIQVSGLNGGPSVEVEALVDTGAVYTVLPASTLRALGVTPDDAMEFEFGDQRTATYDIGEARVGLKGYSRATTVVFGPEDVVPLLGVVVLEQMALMVDPFGRQLVSRRVLRL